jgi:NAD(P)-dependent dehydrogenase (short-subunit alcohol dehydrogenase family)
MSGEDLQLRVAITGGTSGLGLALVRELSCRGARVAFIARNREGVERVVRERPEVSGIVGDVSRKDDIHPIAIQVLGALGGLDVLINNASSLGPVPLVSLADTDCEDLELAIATNLVGPFRLTKALLGSLAASARDGRQPMVVNLSSDAAVTVYAGWGAYGASKAGSIISAGSGTKSSRQKESESCPSIPEIWIRRCTRSPSQAPTLSR